MSMKMKLTTILVLVSLSMGLAAQPAGQRHDGGFPDERGHRGPPSPEQHVLRMSEALDLTSEQITDLLEIFKAAQADTEMLKEQARRQILPELCAIHASTQAQVGSVLSEEQLARMEELKSEHEADQGRHHYRKNRGLECEELADSSS